MFFLEKSKNVAKLPLGIVPLQDGQIALDLAIWAVPPKDSQVLANYARKTFWAPPTRWS